MKTWLICLSGIAATILLGAIGSGVWEKALKPISEWSGRLLLRASFGLFKWTRNSIYLETARGRRDCCTLFLIRALVLALFGIAVFSAGQMHARQPTGSAESDDAKSLQEGTPKAEIIKQLQKETDDLLFKLDILNRDSHRCGAGKIFWTS